MQTYDVSHKFVLYVNQVKTLRPHRSYVQQELRNCTGVVMYMKVSLSQLKRKKLAHNAGSTG